MRGIILGLLLLTACSTVRPPAGSEAGAQSGQWFHLSAEAPVLVHESQWLGLLRHTEWRSEQGHRFCSWAFCPTGLPTTAPTHCVQWYEGIKVDGTWSDQLRRAQSPTPWAWVYTPSEQRAFRWIALPPGPPTADNMAGH